MKTKYPVLLILGCLSCWLVAARMSDVMTELSIDTGKLRQDVLLNLKEPQWFFFNTTSSIRQTARRIPESSRAATVRALGKVVRAYVESSTFKDVWLQDLRMYYPYDETYTDEHMAKTKQDNEANRSAMKSQLGTLDQAFAGMAPAMIQMAIRSQLAQETQELASLSGSERTSKAQYIAELKKVLNLPPADCKKQYLALLKRQAITNIDQSTATPDIDKDQLVQQRRQKAEFDAHADFRPLLKKRLQDFITLTETVDFEARLMPMGRKQEFANPVYQRKPAEWKFLYRLGKAPVMEARAFAQQWLTELH
ncbi:MULTISPECIES: hypothetical protein [unclassified Spirosoma]|uniref:hypothetical protein n=1 Tax=unclassified Spirosoma TaxID=2621999 RepID=UPI000964731A|nr:MULTISPECIES: hypothetical protein [unclassified Spirosoma]MBN8824363.1 hypothetical protein [Spirosoma sp.]OJW70173.1 MAG: hypothetical protein BGO59_26225 [Spirosoma sp. 48-14]